MKTLIIVFVLLSTSSIHAQKIYLDNHFVEVDDSKNAKYYQTSSVVSDTIVERTFYITDTLYEIGRYVKNIYRGKEGANCIYFPNGKLKYCLYYKNNKLNGEVRGYYENGNPKRIDYYKNDTLIQGAFYGLNGSDTSYVPFQKPAKYNGGGLETFNRFIANNIKYPKAALKKGIRGKVVVGFRVSANGEVLDVRALESPDPILSRAAEEVVMKSGPWQPAEMDGKKCSQRFFIPFMYNFQD